MRYNLTDEDRRSMAAKYLELGSGYKAAEHFSVPAHVIYAAVRKLGHNTADYAAATTARRRLVSPELEPEVLAGYRAGLTYLALAERFGIPKTAIRSCIERSGRLERRRGPFPKATDEQKAAIVAQFQAGQPASHIAKSVGLSASLVKKILAGSGEQTKRKYYPRGGEFVGTSGYVFKLVQNTDPMACMRTQTGYVLMHRLVMARAIGRPLSEYETVHHINGDKTDNRLENLQLRQGKHGAGVRHVCADCGSINVVPVPLHEKP